MAGPSASSPCSGIGSESRRARACAFASRAADETIEVFTTRIDTIYGATSVLLSPEHPLVAKLLDGGSVSTQDHAEWDRLRKRVLKTEEIATAEKEGFFTGRYALNPFSGEKIPIWVANFVLAEYGTGALMSVPAHDERDFEFSRKYKLPVRVVVQPLNSAPLDGDTMTAPFSEHDQGTLVGSGPYNGLSPDEAIEKMTAMRKRADSAMRKLPTG